MKYQIFIPLFMAIAYIFYFILSYNVKKESKNIKNKDLIRVPKLILWMGIIGTAIPWIFGVIAICQQLFQVGFIFFIFGFLGLFIISVYINCRIYMDEDKFIVRKAWGKTSVYYYNDVDKVLFRKRVISIIIKNKTINLDRMNINIDKLIRKISKDKYDYTNNHTVQINSSFLIAALLLLLFTLFSYGIGYKMTGSIFILCISLLCLLALIYCINFRITYNDEFFTYRNTIRISKKMNYSGITKVIISKNFIIIKFKIRHIILERSSEGIEAFERKIQSEYKRNH